MICRACGRIEDLDAVVDAAAAERVAAKAGFAVEHGELQAQRPLRLVYLNGDSPPLDKRGLSPFR